MHPTQVGIKSGEPGFKLAPIADAGIEDGGFTHCATVPAPKLFVTQNLNSVCKNAQEWMHRDKELLHLFLVLFSFYKLKIFLKLSAQGLF